MDRSKTRLSTGGTVKQLLLYFLLFLAGDLLSSIAFDLLFSLIPLRARWMYLLLRSLGALGLTWLLFWLYTTHVLGRAMADFGVTLSVRGWAAAAAVLLPAGVTAVYGSLGRWTASPIPLGEAAGTIAASLALALKAGVTEEMLFRGYMMTLVRERWSRRAAILCPRAASTRFCWNRAWPENGWFVSREETPLSLGAAAKRDYICRKRAYLLK